QVDGIFTGGVVVLAHQEGELAGIGPQSPVLVAGSTGDIVVVTQAEGTNADAQHHIGQIGKIELLQIAQTFTCGVVVVPHAQINGYTAELHAVTGVEVVLGAPGGITGRGPNTGIGAATADIDITGHRRCARAEIVAAPQVGAGDRGGCTDFHGGGLA